jgi:hypothetical protein
MSRCEDLIQCCLDALDAQRRGGDRSAPDIHAKPHCGLNEYECEEFGDAEADPAYVVILPAAEIEQDAVRADVGPHSLSSGRIGSLIVGATPRGPASYPLTELTPDQFEVLAFLLAREEFPGTVHIRQNDYGLDARLPDPDGKTIRGWQAKRFTGAIAWSQCQDSVRRAIAFWRPVRITFVFPKILSGGEQQQFRQQLIERFPLATLDGWDASEVQARMRDTPGGQRAADWLFSNPEADKEALRRALAVGGELSTAAPAAERIAEVQQFMGRDPHLQFVTIASDEGTPQPAPTDQTIPSMEATIAGRRIRFDASERYPGAAQDAGLGGRCSSAQTRKGREPCQRSSGSVARAEPWRRPPGSLPTSVRCPWACAA